jgi:hypothetical protein
MRLSSFSRTALVMGECKISRALTVMVRWIRGFDFSRLLVELSSSSTEGWHQISAALLLPRSGDGAAAGIHTQTGSKPSDIGRAKQARPPPLAWRGLEP